MGSEEEIEVVDVMMVMEDEAMVGEVEVTSKLIATSM